MKRVVISLSALAAVVLTCGVSAHAGTSVFDRGPSGERHGGAPGEINIEGAFVKGDYDRVLAIGAAHISRCPKNNERVQCLMARALLKLNRFDESRALFREAAEGSRDKKIQAEANIGMADSYYLNGEYRQARDSYEKTARLYPDYGGMNIVYYSLGECYSKLNNTAAAKEYYDKLTRLYPDSLEAKLLKGEGFASESYSVQAGSFSNPDNAQKLRAELESNGFEACIQTVTVDGSCFYRVRVGNYPLMRDAEEMARNLRNKGYTTKVCP